MPLFGEGAVVVVVEEQRRRRIAGQQDIGPAVVIEIGTNRGEAKRRSVP